MANRPFFWAYCGTVWVLDTVEWQTVSLVSPAVGSAAAPLAPGVAPVGVVGAAASGGGVQPASQSQSTIATPKLRMAFIGSLPSTSTRLWTIHAPGVEVLLQAAEKLAEEGISAEV